MVFIAGIIKDKEEIIRRIEEEKGIPREEILNRIKNKVEGYSGLLTEAGAAFSVAKELGVEVGLGEQREDWMEIGKLKEELGFADIVGVVKAISAVKKWESKGRKGKVVRILIGDGTGDIMVVLWNNDAEVVENGKIRLGSIIGIRNGTITRGLNGRLEINLGLKGKVVIEPSIDREIPGFAENIVGIPDIKEELEGITIFGRVVRKFPPREFETNGRRGKVASMILSDGENETRVVLWGNNADSVKDIRLGEVVKVENGYVKRNGDSLEINLGWKGRLLRNPKNAPEIPEIRVVDRKDIKEMGIGEFCEIRACVVNVFPPKFITVCPVCGEIVEDRCPEHDKSKKTLILNLELDDGTDVVRSVMFRDIAERFLELGDLDKEDLNNYIQEKIRKTLGEELIFRGSVKENKLFERKEFVVRDFEDVDPNIEINMRMGGM